MRRAPFVATRPARREGAMVEGELKLTSEMALQYLPRLGWSSGLSSDQTAAFCRSVTAPTRITGCYAPGGHTMRSGTATD
jgi:hypothetical protein